MYNTEIIVSDFVGDEYPNCKFVCNPVEIRTGIFKCSKGFFVCTKPKGFGLYKNQRVLRPANGDEIEYYKKTAFESNISY